MVSKKNEARFTIKFNPANPRHREAMRVLNEAGRSKAALIADALCLYAHYSTNTAADLMGRAKPRDGAVATKKSPSAIPADTASQKDDVWLTVNESLESFFGESAT